MRERCQSRRQNTIDVTVIWPVLKKRANGPEDEVPGRVCLIRRPLNWLRTWTGVLLKNLLVGRGHHCGSCKGYQETWQATHAAPGDSEEQVLAAAELGTTPLTTAHSFSYSCFLYLLRLAQSQACSFS